VYQCLSPNYLFIVVGVMSVVDGECYTLGCNQFGQLGVSGSSGSCCRVTQLEGHVVTKVACGDTFTVAVTKRMCLCVFVYADIPYIMK